MNPLPPAGGVGPAAIAFSLIGLVLFILVALSVCQSIRKVAKHPPPRRARPSLAAAPKA